MIVGFTATRNGINIKQNDALFNYLLGIKPTEFHQGCAIGGDEDGCKLIREYWSPSECRIIGWPGYSTRTGDRSCQSQMAIELSDEVMPEMGHFARNRQIVIRCQLLVAVTHYLPSQEPEHGSGGGTWYSIQFCARQKKPHAIVWADGSVSERQVLT